MFIDFSRFFLRLITCFICFVSCTANLQAQTPPSLLWAKGIGNVEPSSSPTMNFVSSVIKLDNSGNRYVTGSFTGIADFDPSANNVNLTSTGSYDVFIAKYDSLGRYVWAKRVGGAQADKANDMVLDKNGNVYLIGNFVGTVDFDPGASTVNLVNNSSSYSDIFLAKYDKDGNYIWAKSFGGDYVDVGSSLALDNSNNVVCTGSFEAIVDFDPGPDTAYLKRAYLDDVFLAKYDNNGNFLYAKSLAGNSNEAATSLAVDTSGNIFLTGAVKGKIDLNPGIDSANFTAAGYLDIFIAKYDASGNYVWGKCIGGTADDAPQKLVLDAKANIFLTGNFQNTVDFDAGSGTVNLTSTGGFAMFITKYDSAGSYQWAKSMGGGSYENSKSLALDTSGNILITGYFLGTVDFDPAVTTANLISNTEATTSVTYNDAFLAKYDSLGNYIWAFKFGNAKEEEGSSLAVSTSGNVVVFGYFCGTVDFDPGLSTTNLIGAVPYAKNAFIASYSSTGNYIGANVLGRYNATNIVNTAIIVKDPFGNIYETGSFNGMVDFDPGAGTANLNSYISSNAIYIAKYDSSGNYLWAKSIGGDGADNAYAIKISNKGNVFITGGFTSTVDFDPGSDIKILTSAGNADIFFAKYDGDGNYKWANRIGKTGTDQCNALALDENENVFITGNFSSTSVDFNPGAGTSNLSSAGSTDIFIAKYDSLGVFNWAKKIGGTTADVVNSIVLDSKKNILVTGTFTGTADFDPGASTVNLVSTGNTDIFVAKYDSLGNYIWAKNMGGSTGDVSYSLMLDSIGNSYTTGYFSGTADFDGSSNTANLISAGGNDMFLTKYDSSGNYLWAKSIGSSGDDQGKALAFDANGNLLVTGAFSNTADFNPGIDSAYRSSAGGIDIFLAKYDSAGNYIYAKAMGGTGNDAGNSLVLNNRGNVLLAGTFTNTVDFDPGEGSTNLISISGNQFGFIASYGISNPTSGGIVAASQAGLSPFNPNAFTSTTNPEGQSGILEYKWQLSTNSNNAGFSDIANSNAATYDAGALTVTTWYKRLARVSGFADWSGAIESNVLTVTVTTCTNTSSTETIFSCNQYTWHGTNYTSSNNTATWTGTNAAGCDSVVTLNLTINLSSSSTSTASAIGSYFWNGTTYYNSGTYTYHSTNAEGCDSAATLNLTITVNNISNVCNYIGTNQTLIYTASVAGASSYTWVLPSNTQLVSGQGTRSVVIKILNGFASQSNKQIRVTPAGGNLQIIYLAAQVSSTPSTIVASSSSVCEVIGTSSSITYMIPKAYAATSYIWTAQSSTTNIAHPNGAGENDTIVTVTFSSTFSSSNITVQSVNNCGVSNTRSLVIARNNPSTPGLISGPTNSCDFIGDAGAIANYLIGASANIVSYNWTVPSNAINLTGQGTSSISFKFPLGFTSGTVSVTATNGCGTSGARSLSINKLNPGMPGQIDVINTTTCPNRVYSYTIASMPTNTTSLFWTIPADATLLSGQGTTSISVSYPSTTINGLITVKSFSNCAISSTRSLAIKLSACAPLSPLTKGVSVSTSSEMKLSVYPNPTVNNFNLKVITADVDATMVRVLDVQGRLCKELKVAPFQTINFGAELKSGTYLIEVRQGKMMKLERVVKF